MPDRDLLKKHLKLPTATLIEVTVKSARVVRVDFAKTLVDGQNYSQAIAEIANLAGYEVRASSNGENYLVLTTDGTNVRALDVEKALQVWLSTIQADATLAPRSGITPAASDPRV